MTTVGEVINRRYVVAVVRKQQWRARACWCCGMRAGSWMSAWKAVYI